VARASGTRSSRRPSSEGHATIENPLAVQVLAGRFNEGDDIVVEPNGETFTFRKEAPATVAS
jgi:hypothetical protein